MNLNSTLRTALAAAAIFLASPAARSPADALVLTDFSPSGGDGISFEKVPSAAVDDAGKAARLALVEGTRDANGGDLAVLLDGRLPADSDEPTHSFFFGPGTDGGRLALDLGKPVSIGRVGTYSWHAGTRGPQVYTLYAATGDAADFDPAPKRGTDPVSAGWSKVADVDTRPESGDGGGRHGVSISSAKGALGTFRHLLFDIRRTGDRDLFGNTFFNEIDVVDASAPAPELIAPPKRALARFATADEKYRFTVDATAAPDLLDWVKTELRPVVLEWYPKIVDMLPSEGFVARKDVRLLFRDDMGGTPASAGGDTINMNAGWFRDQLRGEARGAVVHELVHIVQEYPRGLRGRLGSPVPGWITEGIPDYIRWFLYEPETRGAEIRPGDSASAKYDASYRTTANFLAWTTREHGADLVPKLNAAARQGRYNPDLWKELTGKSAEELGAEWKRALAEKPGIE